MLAFAIIFLTIIFVFDNSAFGWGIVTHVELAQSIVTQASALGLAIGGLLMRNKLDFIWGNILADVIIGKKLSPRRKRAHHWAAGWRLLEHANTDQTKAFAHGFITHLAADTVAHNDFVPRQIIKTGSTVSLGHLYWELMADQLASGSDRKTARRILRVPSLAHEELLENHLYPQIKWYGLNRNIFMNVSRFTHGRRFTLAVRLCRELSLQPLEKSHLVTYKTEALDRMIDILKNGKKSALMKEDPNGIRAMMEIHESRRSR